VTHLGCGGNLSDRCITNFLLILTYLLTYAGTLKKTALGRDAYSFCQSDAD